MASEFVTMAAHLMYIKTRMLLSLEDEEAKNEMDALIQSLAERQRGEAYARVRRLAELLGPMGEFGRSILTRPPEPVERGKVYEYDQRPGDLVIAMQEMTDRRGRRRRRRCVPLTRLSSGSPIPWSRRPRRSSGG